MKKRAKILSEDVVDGWGEAKTRGQQEGSGESGNHWARGRYSPIDLLVNALDLKPAFF